MALSAQLLALTLPSGTEFPGTPQELLELIQEYMEITGLNPFNGINYGPTTPDASNRDRPWFKTDSSGNPIGWYSWNGSAWTPIPATMPSGSTANRPSSPPTGTQYFDTDIAVALIFERSQWRTLAGSPGDIKFVRATTIDDALAANPGWARDETADDRVIAGAGSDHAYGELVGEDTTLLAEDNLPAHVHTYDKFSTPARWQADGNAANAAGNLAAYQETSETNTGAVGDQNPISTLQPTVYRWCLYKE
jgi:hypothetical protein